MPGILDSLSSMLTPDMVNKLGRAINIDPTLINKGMTAIGPVVLGGLARTASTPDGATALLRQLPRDTGGNWLETLSGLLSGGARRPQPDMADSLFGAGANAVGATISQKLGFNVRPLLGMATPMIAGLVGKAVKSQGLDAQGLTSWLAREQESFMKNPANKETAGLVFSALTAGDKATALREAFDEAEWLKVRMGPVAALYHVATSSVSGPVGLVKEFTAAADAVSEAARSAPPMSLIGAAFATGLSQDELTRLSREHPKKEALLTELHDCVEIVARRSPGDAQAYRDVVLNAARNAAEATKEGGVFGIGGTRVSEAEQRALDDIRSALS